MYFLHFQITTLYRTTFRKKLLSLTVTQHLVRIVTVNNKLSLTVTVLSTYSVTDNGIHMEMS